MPDFLGQQTETLLLKSESHKMAHEFEVAGAAVSKLQKVKLNNAGNIVALAADDDEHLHIGYTLHDAAVGEKATVVVRAYALIKAEAQAAVNAGPVRFKGFNSTTKRNTYAAATTAAHTIGWTLNAATSAGDELWVLVKN
jgi:hypothetical protein